MDKEEKLKNSLSGLLSEYANSSLIKFEENVWFEEAKDSVVNANKIE